MAARSNDDPYSATVRDVVAQMSSLRLNGSIIKRQAMREQHTMPLTYSRLRSISDHHQQKPRRVQHASSHMPSHGKGRSLRSARHSGKVLKKSSWVGETGKSVESVARVGAVTEQSLGRTNFHETCSTTTSGCNSPSVRVDARKVLRYDRIPKRLNGVGKDKESCESVVLHCCASDRSQSLGVSELNCDFDTLTLFESANPLVKVTAKLRSEILRTEDDDESAESWCSSLERQPGDGCVDETSVTWSDEDVLSNLSAEEDEGDLEATSSIHLDDNLNGTPILPEIPLLSPLKRKQFLASCSPSKISSPPSNAKIISCDSGGRKEKLVDYRLPKRSQSLTFPTDNTPKQVPVKSDEGLTAKTMIRMEPASPLFSSLFPNIPPSIYFPLMDEQYTPLPYEIRRLLKWKMSTITPNVIKQCIARVGFTKSKTNRWLGYWGKHMKSEAFRHIRPYQKVNHFPGTFQIGRKDRLWRNLSRMQTRFKKDYDFFPKTYILPTDIAILRRVWDEGAHKKWILKPPASARGIGVRVIHKWSQVPKKRPVIVQKYLSSPFLINGSKFDLRVYVYVTSYDPLRIYVFKEGLARFATCKYSTSTKSLSNRFIHLTNYSINKKNSSFTPNTDETVCQGHKWGLLALWSYMETNMGIDTASVWESIKSLVIKTIIASESSVASLLKLHVKKRYCCHELFGFDVMLDKNLKPWILEVNISPSLHSNSQLDVNIKGHMVRDLLNMSGFPVPSDELFQEKPQEATLLTPTEKAKHIMFVQKYHLHSNVEGILEDLTDDDIRIIMETEDELSRCGMFERVFPSSKAMQYHQFFDVKRYYNLLLQEWVKFYHKNPLKGIGLIRSLSQARDISY